MGNIVSSKQPYKSMSSKSTEQQWKMAIKKQLQQNVYMYLRYEIYDEMTYHSGRTEISKRKLLCLLKIVLSEMQLSFFVTITPTNKSLHYFINVSIIYYIKREPEQIEEEESVLSNNSSQYSSSMNHISSFSLPT